MHTLLLLLVLFLSAYGQVQFSVLRDRVQGDAQGTQELIDLSGAPIGLLLEGVPYIDSEATWLIPLGNGTGGLLFEEIYFNLATNAAAAEYAISGVDIRNLIAEGSCGQPASQLAVITRMGVEIRSPGPERAVNSSCYIEDGFLDLDRMGLSRLNPVIRFSFPPIEGNQASLFIEGTAPQLGQGEAVSVCLQTDFRAVTPPQGGAAGPPPTPSSLLQYNMNAPTFLVTLDQLFDDEAYTGARRSLYTGGTGTLTDGVIGTDPFLSPEAWVGYQEPDQAGLRLFLNQSYPVKEIRVYFWNELALGVASPMGGVRNRAGNRIMQFSFSTQAVDPSVPDLSVYTGIVSPPMQLDYLELILRAPDQALLLTEVSVMGEVAPGQLVNLASELSDTFFPEIGTEIGTGTGAETGASTTSPVPPAPGDPEVLTVVYASVGIIGFLSLLIVCMCMLFLGIFLCMRSGAKKRAPPSPVPKHSSLMRQLSDRYLGTGEKTCYNQFEAGPDLYTEMENIYQQVDRPLPLPPPPGPLSKEDSYIEMQQTGQKSGIGLRIDTGERPPLRPTRTLSEDDYAPVTPPSAPSGSKEPPARLISDPYVAVTPPHNAETGFKLRQETIEEKYEAVTPPDSAGHTMATLGMSSIPNQYVSMAPADTTL